MSALDDLDLNALAAKVNARLGPGHTVEWRYAAHPVGTWSLAGVADKVSATRYLAVIRDGEVIGRLELDDS